jgi:hypothetical protein
MPRFAEEKQFTDLIKNIRIQYPDKLKIIYTDIDEPCIIFEVMPPQKKYKLTSRLTVCDF